MLVRLWTAFERSLWSNSLQRRLGLQIGTHSSVLEKFGLCGSRVILLVFLLQDCFPFQLVAGD